MKTLLLIRHAKSSWGNADLPDHDRPLNERGRRDAPEMGRRLQSNGIDLDLILTSTAVRARMTAAAIAGPLGYDPARIVEQRGLYGASPQTLLEAIGSLDDKMACVILVGHNPGITELAQQFSEDIEHMPTCAVAIFDFDATAWSQLSNVVPRSVQFDYPKKKSG